MLIASRVTAARTRRWRCEYCLRFLRIVGRLYDCFCFLFQWLVLIDMWNIIAEVGKAETKQESMEVKGHNNDCRTKSEREKDHGLWT